MKIIETETYKTASKLHSPSSGAVVYDTEEPIEPEQEWDKVDQEIDRQFGRDITRRRKNLDTLKHDFVGLRKRNPAGFNYLTRRVRQDLLPIKEYTLETPMTPPKK